MAETRERLATSSAFISSKGVLGGRPCQAFHQTMPPKQITEQLLKTLSKKDKLYTTPRLNDRLYLNYQGLGEISGLEEYTGLKALWLENNAIGAITGLSHLTELRSLFLHQNCLRNIQGLENLVHLDTLNISRCAT